MKKLALIQTCGYRQNELIRFLKSLNSQKDLDFSTIQYIFIDQGNNKEIFSELNKQIEFIYIKNEKCSLSHARNIGLKYVNAQYVSFPDDDCWYDSRTLSNVIYALKKYPDGISILAMNENDIPINSFPKKTAIISKLNRRGALSISIFLKFFNDISFDERLGVGSQYRLGAGEETDYLINLIEKKNCTITYLPNIYIRHPLPPKNNKFDYKKIYEYARGSGFLLKKHSFPLPYIIRFFIRPLVGCIIYSILLKRNKAKKSYYILKGKIEGYTYKIRNQ